MLVPLNWRLTGPELARQLADCEPALLFADSMVDRLESVDFPMLPAEEFKQALEAAEPAAISNRDASRPSLMLYTSGTSGVPKGVPLTEANLAATALNSVLIMEVSRDSAFLVDAPMFHIIGMVTNVRPTLLVGGTIVISDGFKPEVTLDRMADPSLGITHYFCVPQMAEMLRAAPNFDPERLRGLKAILTGGAPHPAERIREWLADGIAIVDGYGSTEAGTVLGMPFDLDLIARKAGSAGLASPSIEHRIEAEDSSLCKAGEVGELLLRGPSVFHGYWRNPEESARSFTGDGYFRTGDLAREDEYGYFVMVGRSKDMFISGGENVYPAEVEAVLKLHDDVVEAAVIGVADSRWGEVGHAFLILREGRDLDEAALRALCDRNLARYKHPVRILRVDDLPRTGSGKVAKGELRKLAPA